MPSQSLASAVLPIVLQEYNPATVNRDTVRLAIISTANSYNVWGAEEVKDLSEQAGDAFDAVTRGAWLLAGDTITIGYSANSGNKANTRSVAAWVLRQGQRVGGYVPY